MKTLSTFMKGCVALAFFLLTAQCSQAQYCLPTYANPCTSGDYIDGFTFNTINNGGTGCATPGVNNYTDYTSISTTVIQGNTYSVTCSPGPNWGQYFVLWIDFNQDQDFDEVNEFFDIGYAAAGGFITNNITIPTGVMGGTTRLRVLCHFGTGPIGQADACAAQTWGEVEDYTVTVGNPPQWDASLDAVTQPNTGCGLGQESVEVTIGNNGLDTIQTVVVCYRIDGGAPVCDTLNNMGLLPGTSVAYIHSTLADVSLPADYTFDAWTILLNDSVPQNDTLFGYMMTSIPTVAGLPYMEDFENGTGGWLPSGNASSWEHGVPANVFITPDTSCSGGNAWVTQLAGTYNPNEDSQLESPCIDFSGLTTDPILRFDHIFQVEPGFEDHWVEVSTDGGTTWNTLGGAGTGLNWYNQPSAWDNTSGNPGEWRIAQHTLTGTADSSDVRIRFKLTSDGSVQQEGVGIDNIMIFTSLDDAQANTVDGPTSGCGMGMDTIVATFQNMGTDTLFSLPVCYTVNGGAPVCETIMDTIPPLATYQYTFTTLADFTTFGDYDIAAYSNLATDSFNCKDTAWASVTNVTIVNTYPYIERFENGSGGWVADNTVNGSWTLGLPAKVTIMGAASGVNAWTTGGLGTGTYSANDNSFVLSPCFDFTNLPADPWVAMSIWWESEFSWDGAALQYTLDSGATWVNVGAFGSPNNWYTDNTINGNPGGQQEGWTGTIGGGTGSNGWVNAKHPLDTALIGETDVRFRMAFGSDGSVQFDGVAFDDFAISTPPDIDLGPDYVGCGTSVNPGWPGTYEWFLADTAGGTPMLASTDPWVDLTNSGSTDTTYNVIVVYTDTFGLCDSDTMMATVSPTPYTQLGPDTAICPVNSIWLYADAAPQYTYLWSSGETVDSALQNGTTLMNDPFVMVTVTDTVSGCSHSDSINIWVTPPVALADTFDVCDGDSVMLDAGAGYSSYAWNTGDSTQTVWASASASFSVDVTDSIGCMSSDSALVLLHNLPAVSIMNAPDTMCENHTITLDGGAGFFAYVWSTGGSSQAETISGASLNSGQTNNITLTVTDGNGCMNTDQVSIFVDPCVGIDEAVGELVVSYYPNPTNSFLYIQVENGELEDLAVELIGLGGKAIPVQMMTTGDAVLQLDMNHVAPGIYYLRLNSNTGTYVGKIVVN